MICGIYTNITIPGTEVVLIFSCENKYICICKQTSGFIMLVKETSIIRQPDWNSDLRSERVIKTGVLIVQCRGLSPIVVDLFSEKQFI